MYVDKGSLKALRHCELAIIFDRPDVLGKLLDNIQPLGEREAKELNEFCEALERNHCKDILSEHGILFKELHMSRQRKVDLLASVLVTGTVNLLGIIGPQLANLSDGSVFGAIDSTQSNDLEVFDWGFTEYGIGVGNESDFNDINYRVIERFSDEKTLQTWLDTDLGPIARDGHIYICSYLEWLWEELNEDAELQNDTVCILSVRRCLEALLFANPVVTGNAVIYGFDVDQRFHLREKKRFWFVPARFILDCEDHGMLGHDDLLALNMTVPLLIESGFPVTKKLSDLIKSEKKLAIELYTYVQHAITTPKTFKASCRDALRRHFVGRGIHRFIDANGADIPSYVKDFILLKPLLRCIPKQLLEKLSKKFLE